MSCNQDVLIASYRSNTPSPQGDNPEAHIKPPMTTQPLQTGYIPLRVYLFFFVTIVNPSSSTCGSGFSFLAATNCGTSSISSSPPSSSSSSSSLVSQSVSPS